jgi:hypothetical protein
VAEESLRMSRAPTEAASRRRNQTCERNVRDQAGDRRPEGAVATIPLSLLHQGRNDTGTTDDVSSRKDHFSRKRTEG